MPDVANNFVNYLDHEFVAQLKLNLNDLGPTWEGQAGVVVGAQEDNTITVGQSAAFVVFANTRVERCSWSLYRKEGEQLKLVTTKPVATPQVLWTPTEDGEFHLKVELYGSDGSSIDAISILQTVKPADKNLSRLDELRREPDVRMAPIPGDLKAFLRLVYSIYPVLRGIETTDISVQAMAIHCYTALTTSSSGTRVGRKDLPLESLFATVAPKEQLAEVSSGPVLAELSGLEREGSFGLSLAHVALFIMRNKLQLDASQLTARKLVEAFKKLDSTDKSVLITRLRFPKAAIAVMLQASGICLDEWRQLAGTGAVISPDVLQHDEREATLVGLLQSGGATFATVKDKKFKATGFQHAFVANRGHLAFEVFLWPTEKHTKCKAEWDEANKGNTDGDEVWRKLISTEKGFIGGYYNYTFLYDKYQSWATNPKTTQYASELGIDLEKKIDSEGKLGVQWVNPVLWLKRNLVVRSVETERVNEFGTLAGGI